MLEFILYIESGRAIQPSARVVFVVVRGAVHRISAEKGITFCRDLRQLCFGYRWGRSTKSHATHIMICNTFLDLTLRRIALASITCMTLCIGGIVVKAGGLQVKQYNKEQQDSRDVRPITEVHSK